MWSVATAAAVAKRTLSLLKLINAFIGQQAKKLLLFLAVSLCHPSNHGVPFVGLEPLGRENIHIDVNGSVRWQRSVNKFPRGNAHGAAGCCSRVDGKIDVDVPDYRTGRHFNFEVQV